MSSQAKAIGALLFGIGAGIYFFITGLQNWKWKRLIENTPTSKIRGIAMGLVEICGTVSKPLKTCLSSPFTGKDCVYYSYTIEEYRRQGKSSHWVTIKSDAQTVPFYLKDTTGAVLVDARGAQIDLPKNLQIETSAFSTLPKQVQAFCAKNNFSAQSWFFGLSKRLRFTEHCIPRQQQLYIMGTAGDNPYIEEATAQNSVDDIMIQKGKNIPFYYISSEGEKQALANFAWKVYGGIYGGGTLFLVCLAILMGIIGLF